MATPNEILTFIRTLVGPEDLLVLDYTKIMVYCLHHKIKGVPGMSCQCLIVRLLKRVFPQHFYFAFSPGIRRGLLQIGNQTLSGLNHDEIRLLSRLAVDFDNNALPHALYL